MALKFDTQEMFEGFLRYVPDEKREDYEKEYYSRSIHNYKFFIPFIYRYVDIDKAVKDIKSREEEIFLAYFLNVYCEKQSKMIRGLNEAKNIRHNIDRKFLFK